MLTLGNCSRRSSVAVVLEGEEVGGELSATREAGVGLGGCKGGRALTF